MFTTHLKPGQGKLLLAEPFMDSPEFKRTVVLLTEHSDNGSMGFIMNRKLVVKLTKAIDNFPDFDDVLYYGGPVSNEMLFYIHTLGEAVPGSIEIINGIFLGGDFEMLKKMIADKKAGPGDVKFFAGYSGWSAGQLKKEIKQNSWIVAPTDKKYFNMEGKTNLWKYILRDMGGSFAMMADFPEDPSLN